MKPANILVTAQGIKLLDFGLAKQSGALPDTEATLTAALTGKGQILGILQYISPEQLHGKETDSRGDLFSFGCQLYEMLSGKRAFEGQSAASVIAAILEREPAPLDAPPSVMRVIATCIQKNPDQRFQNALDLRRALVWAVQQEHPPIGVNRPKLRPWLAAALALTPGALSTGTVIRLLQHPPIGGVLRLQLDPPQGGEFLVARSPNNPGGLTVSPDGRVAAYVAAVNGKSGLWLRPLDARGHGGSMAPKRRHFLSGRPTAGRSLSPRGASYTVWIWPAALLWDREPAGPGWILGRGSVYSRGNCRICQGDPNPVR